MKPLPRFIAWDFRSVSRICSLRTNFLWNAFGSAAFALSQWGILVVFAKLGTPTLVGQLVYAIAVTAPLFVIASLQLRSIQATDCANRYTLGQYLGLRFWSTFCALVITMIVAASVLYMGNLSGLFILLWGLCKTVDSASDALYGLFQQAERMDYVGFSLAIRGVSAVALTAFLYMVTGSPSLSIAGIMAGWTIIALAFDVPMARALFKHQLSGKAPSGNPEKAIHPALNPKYLRMLLAEAAPLGIVAFLLAIQVQIPRYVIAIRLHTHELGLFSAASYVTFIGSTLINALGAPACVRLAKHYATGEHRIFKKILTKMLIASASLGTVGVLLAAIFGHQILTLLYTKEYAHLAGVLTMLCVGSAVSFLASSFGYAMTALQRYRIQVPIFLCVVVVTACSCYWLTLSYGLMGTAAGTVIGSITQLFMSAGVVTHAMQNNNARKEPPIAGLFDVEGSLS